MNNKMRRTIALMLALLMTVCCVMLTACSKKGNDNSASADETSTTVVTQPATEGKKFATLASSYKPAMAFDLTGNPVELTQVYGSGFKEYGGELSFKDDGTFTAFIGVYGNADAVTGTYTVLSMSEIELKFNNDTTKTAVITATDVEGNAVEIRIQQSDYNVIFQK